MAATTFSQLFDEIKTEALNLWQSVKNEAAYAETKIVPVVESDLVTILGQLKTVALNTVLNLAGAEFANLTGTQKNSLAVNTVLQVAVATGKTIAQQDGQLLVQQAYNALASAVTAAK